MLSLSLCICRCLSIYRMQAWTLWSFLKQTNSKISWWNCGHFYIYSTFQNSIWYIFSIIIYCRTRLYSAQNLFKMWKNRKNSLIFFFLFSTEYTQNNIYDNLPNIIAQSIHTSHKIHENMMTLSRSRCSDVCHCFVSEFLTSSIILFLFFEWKFRTNKIIFIDKLKDEKWMTIWLYYFVENSDNGFIYIAEMVSRFQKWKNLFNRKQNGNDHRKKFKFLSTCAMLFWVSNMHSGTAIFG